MRYAAVTLLLCCSTVLGCRSSIPDTERSPLSTSGWIADMAIQRGYIRPGDVAQFGCPPGWSGIEDTAVALQGKDAAAVYVGLDPKPRDGTVTCVAQREFALPQQALPNTPEQQPSRQPLAPIWLVIGPDKTTIGFRSELQPSAPIYFAQDTPCGPRVIGVRLGDLLKWLVDPETAPKRDFLGMVSAGC